MSSVTDTSAWEALWFGMFIGAVLATLARLWIEDFIEWHERKWRRR